MIKKLFLLGLVVTQLTTSCSNDNNDNNETDSGSLQDQIANLMKQPYSKLTPAEQKVKLEAEANAMLVEMDKSKTSSAIEALENLERLLDISSVDIFNGKNDNKVEDIINVSGVYGIYTWNNTKKTWDKTSSTTELKFVFPSKETQSSNNASLATKSTSSDIKVEITDTYDWSNDIDVNDYFYLPTSTNAILTIDSKEAATISQSAKYSNGKETPDEFEYKMSLIDGYSWEMNSKKATENTAKANLTYNGKNLIKFTSGSTAQIDALLDNEEVSSYRGKANGLVELMDNFIIVADMDIAGLGKDEEALDASLTPPGYLGYLDYQNPKTDFKAHYTAENVYNKKHTEENVINYNKNMKLILVSKKDGTKIADIIYRSEKGYSHENELPVWVNNNNNGGYWTFNGGEKITIQYYDQVLYLKFNDATEVEMSAYFSTGFEKFETKFEDFIKSFEK